MPSEGVIDWHTHIGAVLNGFEAMRRLVKRWHDDPQMLSPILAQEMRWIALRLQSRHIPREVQMRFPEIPWHGLSAWLARHDAAVGAGMPILGEDTAPVSFARTAPALTAPLKRLQEELVMTAADGNRRDGVLAFEERATFAHMTLRLPTDRVPFVIEALGRAYNGVDAPTMTGVRAALASVSDALDDLGVSRLRLIGSVARGTATPASDIDLLYEASPTENAWQVWCDLLALLEGTLGRVVDLHDAERMPTRSRTNGVTVWKRRRSDRKRRTKP